MITLCVEKKNYYMYYKEAVIQHLIINNIIYVYLSALAFIFFPIFFPYSYRVCDACDSSTCVIIACVRFTYASKANALCTFYYVCVHERRI